MIQLGHKLPHTHTENHRECGLTSTMKHPSALILLFLIAAASRLVLLGRDGLWMDECFTWMAVNLPWRDIYALSYEDVHPPLYYFLVKIALPLLPATEAGLRLPSVLLSLSCIAVTYHFLATSISRQTALLGVAILAILPVDLYFAREARMYALQSLCVIGSLHCLVRSVNGSEWSLLGWAISASALAWTHAYGLIMGGRRGLRAGPTSAAQSPCSQDRHFQSNNCGRCLVCPANCTNGISLRWQEESICRQYVYSKHRERHRAVFFSGCGPATRIQRLERFTLALSTSQRSV
jgi:hypothetical protein